MTAAPTLTEKAVWRLRRFTLPSGADLGGDARLVVAGLFSTASGVGQSARACLEGLQKLGVAASAVDLSWLFNQVDLPSEGWATGLERPETGGTLILHLNAPETEIALFRLGLRRWRRWRVIAYWAWELPVAPASWRGPSRHVSEVWTPSAFVRDAIASRIAKPVRVAPHHVPVPKTTGPAATGSAITCLVMADARSSFHRKNALGAIDLFQRAFRTEERARLLLKCRNVSEYDDVRKSLSRACESDRRIELIDASLPADELFRLMSRADIVLSPHRSEGFGLHLAEAMALAKPVIATGWSGNMEFMTDRNSALVPYRLAPAIDPYNVYKHGDKTVWAEPDLAAGAEMLRSLAHDPAARRRLGDQARRTVSEKLNGEAYIQALDKARSGPG